MIKYYVFITVFIILFYFCCFVILDNNQLCQSNEQNTTEHMNGALIQLMTKGPQDLYLTNSHIYPIVDFVADPIVYSIDNLENTNCTNNTNYTKTVNKMNYFATMQTPFVWGNSTKVSKKWGYYNYINNIHQWYLDSYLYN